jgi:hypothetical protein
MSPFLSENLRRKSRKMLPGAAIPNPARRSASFPGSVSIRDRLAVVSERIFGPPDTPALACADWMNFRGSGTNRLSKSEIRIRGRENHAYRRASSARLILESLR